jgi:prepilin peptidase CpaA
MNLISYAPQWLAALLAIALLAGALEDAIRLRISNVTCLAVIAGAVFVMARQGFPLALWQNASVFFAILVLGTLAFSRNLLGGGDVKLLAATGLWVGFATAPWLLAAIFLAGGAVAILYLAVRLFRGVRPKEGKGGYVPYGVAIAAGALFVLGTQYAKGPQTNFHPLPPIKGVHIPRK